jgi:hypothetical protein
MKWEAPSFSDPSRLRLPALIVGLGALALAGFGAAMDPTQFYVSYLETYLFWLGITLGCSGILMVHHLVGGRWGVPIWPLLEKGAHMIPVMILFFIPILLGRQELFSWTRPEAAHDVLLQKKALYLNVPFFVVRACLYFVLWSALAFLIRRGLSIPAGAGEEIRDRRRLQYRSGAGLLVYVLSVSFASVDWIMSIEPHWYSSIFGAIVICGQMLSGYAFAIVLAIGFRGLWRQPDLETRTLHDLGNLLLMSVMLWAYMSFSQYLIMWSGQLPDELPWYYYRTSGTWRWVGLVLIVFHFAIPFCLLLSRPIKKNMPFIFVLTLFILVMRGFDQIWLVAPLFRQGKFPIHWLDISVGLGIGGVWLFLYFTLLSRARSQPLSPVAPEGSAILADAAPQDRPRQERNPEDKR